MTTDGVPAPMVTPAVDANESGTSDDDSVDIPDLSWQKSGECTATDADGNALHTADEFFLEGRFKRNSREYRAAVAHAKQVCGGCPAKDPCLAFAIAHNLESGIWGGLTYWERRAIRYPRRRIKGKLTYIKENE